MQKVSLPLARQQAESAGNGAEFSPEKPFVIFTGASRGIGKALAGTFGKSANILTLGRNSCENSAFIPWHLEKKLTENRHAELAEFLKTHRVAGFVHCAGVLGPLGMPKHYDAGYWNQFAEAMQVNCLSALEIIDFIAADLKGQSTVPIPFVMHLSSGAAKRAYGGWDAYCASKSSALMAFQCLAMRYEATQLLCLSIAPGTVLTDMMKEVLKSSSADFPDIEKFKKLEREGGLVDPQVPAQKIAELVFGKNQNLRALHGRLFDVRTGLV